MIWYLQMAAFVAVVLFIIASRLKLAGDGHLLHNLPVIIFFCAILGLVWPVTIGILTVGLIVGETHDY